MLALYTVLNVDKEVKVNRHLIVVRGLCAPVIPGAMLSEGFCFAP